MVGTQNGPFAVGDGAQHRMRRETPGLVPSRTPGRGSRRGQPPVVGWGHGLLLDMPPLGLAEQLVPARNLTPSLLPRVPGLVAYPAPVPPRDVGWKRPRPPAPSPYCPKPATN